MIERHFSFLLHCISFQLYFLVSPTCGFILEAKLIWQLDKRRDKFKICLSWVLRSFVDDARLGRLAAMMADSVRHPPVVISVSYPVSGPKHAAFLLSLA
jgi:hypothetical protein